MKQNRIQVQVEEESTILSGHIFYCGDTNNLVGVNTSDLEKLDTYGNCYSLGWRTASMIRSEVLQGLSGGFARSSFDKFFEEELAPYTGTKLFKWYELDKIQAVSSLELILKKLEEDVKR